MATVQYLVMIVMYRKKVQSWNRKYIAWYAFENDQRNRTLNHNGWKLKNACGSFRDTLVLMV